MNKKIRQKSEHTPTFWILLVSLFFGIACMAIEFADMGMLSFSLPFFQSPAMFAICLMVLGAYDGTAKNGVFIVAFILFAIYFAVSAAINFLALIPLVCCVCLTFCAKNGFQKPGTAKIICGIGIVSSLACSFLTAANIRFTHIAGDAVREMLSALMAGRLAYIGFVLFGIVPMLFFAACIIHLRDVKNTNE